MHTSTLDALRECEEYFDQRADADCDQDGFIPNEEMKLLQVVRDALRYRPASASGSFAKSAMDAINGLEADRGEPLQDDHEIGRVEESNSSPSFRIRVGHIRRLASEAAQSSYGLKDDIADLREIRGDILDWLPESRSSDLFKATLIKRMDAAIARIEARS